MKPTTKVCGVTIVVLLLAFAALGPGKWIPRSGLGWQMDHVLGFFAFTWMVCLAWPRAFVVGGAITVFAVLLEALQAFTPDRHPDLQAALYSVVGVLAAALTADLFMIAARRLNGRRFWLPQLFMLRSPSRNNARAGLLAAARPAHGPGSAVVRGAGIATTGIGRPIAVRLTASRRLRETF